MRRLFTLANSRLLERCIEVIREAHAASKRPIRVEVKGPKRNNDQNAALWCKLGDIAEQVEWPRRDAATGEMHPMLMEAESWKLFFLDELRRSYDDDRRLLDLVPNADGTGWVNVGNARSSDLTVEEMGDMLTIISAFGDNHGVEWSEPAPKDLPPSPPIEAYTEENA
jgi:hypothetical protein